MSTAAEKRYTVDEYLELERSSNDVKHEFYDGEIFAMTGGSGTHSLIIGNCVREIGNGLKGKGCRVLPTEMQVFCPTGLRTYPDISIVCGAPEYEGDKNDVLLNPVAIVEVLSPSTEAYDRGKKFNHYQTITSLKEYVLVAQDSVEVAHYVRQSEHDWRFESLTDINTDLRFSEIDCAVPLAEIYSIVDFLVETDE